MNCKAALKVLPKDYRRRLCLKWEAALENAAALAKVPSEERGGVFDGAVDLR
jgi:hypothetical protein